MTQTYGTAYYIAPEVLNSEYNEKCDIWSVGVILFILLSGRPPFDGNDDKEIIKNVRTGEYKMSGAEFRNISHDAKDFIRAMLTKNVEDRIDAITALNHQWIKNKVDEPVDTQATIAALNNLKNFRVCCSLLIILILYRLSKRCSKQQSPSS
jgi:calcium-dependent protein kinase